MSLTGLAQQTLEIIDCGTYTAPSGKTIEVRAAVDAAIRGTVLYRPRDLNALAPPRAPDGASPPRIEVTPETTAEAGRRLSETEGAAHVVALNIALAKNPGGGFLKAPVDAFLRRTREGSVLSALSPDALSSS